MTDPIADMLTRMRNAIAAKHSRVDIPASKLKLEIARILKEEGYIQDYEVLPDDKQGHLRIVLRYLNGRDSVIQHIERVSKPGRRIYVGKADIQRVLGGLGIAILSTPRGVLTDSAARRAGVGGELLLKVY